MLRIEGLTVDGLDYSPAWSEDDGDVGDWQSLLSQGIATVGSIINNREAAKASKRVVGLQGGASMSPIAWQAVPGTQTFQPPPPVRAASSQVSPNMLMLGAVVLVGGLFLLRRR